MLSDAGQQKMHVEAIRLLVLCAGAEPPDQYEGCLQGHLHAAL